MGIGNFLESVGRVSQGWNAAEDEKRVRARAEMQDKINAYGLADLERQRAEQESERAAIQAAVQSDPNITPAGLAAVAQRVRAQRGDFEGMKRLGDPEIEALQRQTKLYEAQLENDPELRAAREEIMRGQIPQLKAESKMKLADLADKTLTAAFKMFSYDPEGATKYISDSGILFPGRKISKAGMAEIGGKKMFVFLGEDGKPLGAMPEAEVQRRLYGEKKPEVIKFDADQGLATIGPDGKFTQLRAPQPSTAKLPNEARLADWIQADPANAAAYQKLQSMKGKSYSEKVQGVATELFAKNMMYGLKNGGGLPKAIEDAKELIRSTEALENNTPQSAVPGAPNTSSLTPKKGGSKFSTLPSGSKLVGIKNGREVYQTPDGKYVSPQ